MSVYGISHAEFIIDDLKYEINEDNTASVVGSVEAKPSQIIIPDFIEYGEKEYKVVKIDDYAFQNNINLEHLILPSGLKYIGRQALQQSRSLKSLEFPSGLETIGYLAFNETGISHIDLPESMLRIEQAAFSASSLKEVTIRSDIEYGKDVFNNTRIETLNFMDNVTKNPDVFPKDFVKTVNIECQWESLNANAFSNYYEMTNINLPSGLTVIGDYAFAGCKSLTNIKFPETLSNIGKNAFAGCISLDNVVLPSGINIIEEGMFNGCTALSSVSFPQSLTSIEDKAFSDCSELSISDFPESLTYIGEEAFIRCNSLTSLILPPNLSKIGNKAFLGCGIKILDLPSNLNEIGWNAFEDCIFSEVTIRSDFNFYIFTSDNFSQVEKVTFTDNATTIPDFLNGSMISILILGEGVNTIEENALAGCKNLANVNFPTTLKTIGANSFASCTRLTSIKLPEYLTTLGARAFAGCENLEEIIFGDALTKINNETFMRCRSLKTVVLPSNLKNLGYSCFIDCSSLESVILPSSLEVMEYRCFKDCHNLRSIKMNETKLVEISQECFIGCTGLESVYMPNSVTTVYPNAFSDCSSISDIVFSDSLQEIKSEAFSNCSGYEVLTLPKTMSKIGDKAFLNNSKLNTLYLAGSVNYGGFGENVFENCNNIKNITIGNYPENFFSNNDSKVEQLTLLDNAVYIPHLDLTELTYLNIGTGIKTLNNCRGASKLKKVEVEGESSVESIDNYAFSNCSSLESFPFDLMPNLRWIGAEAFSGCESLSGMINLYLNPTAYSVINNKAFEYCKNIESINVMSDFYWGEDVFYGCEKLKEINFTDNVTTLPSNSIYNGTDIENIVITGQVTTIPESAFANLSSLKTVTLPICLKKIESYAFQGCVSLENIVLPSTLESIYALAFANCKALETITLPDNLQVIAGNCLNGCDALKTIFSLNPEPPTLITDYFAQNITYYTDLLVPKGAVHSYKWAVGWREFFHLASYVEPEAIFLTDNGFVMESPSMSLGSTYDMYIETSPADAGFDIDSSRINYYIEGDDCVEVSLGQTVDSEGVKYILKCKSINVGQAILTVNYNCFNGTVLSYSCEINVWPNVFDLDPSEIIMKPGETSLIKLITEPEIPMDLIEWYSFDSSIAEVSQDGLVTAYMPGETYIEASTYFHMFDRCKIIVEEDSGIDNLFDDENDEVTIYSLSGLLVKAHATKEDLKSLVKGAYIIKTKNTTKIIII